MSKQPVAETPRGKLPTGVVPGSWSHLPLQRSAEGGSSPHGKSRPSAPRAARSHSASVGRRRPAHAQYSRASAQVTFTTGWRETSTPARPSGGGGGARPVAAQKARYWAQVTSYLPIQ